MSSVERPTPGGERVDELVEPPDECGFTDGWYWRGYADDPSAWLFRGDSAAVMNGWPPECVDAIVTSPEYADQRKYAHGADTRPDAYAEHFAPFLDAMQWVIKPTGSLMLNLGVIMRKGEESPYADEVLARARAMGWKLLARTIWHKSNPLPLSHPPYLTIAHEWVFWLAKDVGAYRGYDKDTRTPHAEVSLRRINEAYLQSKDERYARRGKTNALHPDGARPTTVFTAAVGSTRGIKHPAPMSLELAKYLVSLSCPPGGVVLDPFCGSGTSLVAAVSRRRKGIGIDLNAQYLDEARDRLTAAIPAPALWDEEAS